MSLLIALLVFAYARPIPQAAATGLVPTLPAAAAVSLPWPAYGQSAIGAVGHGVLASSGSQKSAPMASTAKVITALVVLKQKPLQPGSQGPAISLTDADAALYEKYYALGGSVTQVAVGSQISQYQALQALLLPSANNIADTLAVWAFGSVDNYLKSSNQYVQAQGLTDTKIADATGFSDQTISTANNLVKVGELALNNPVIADIVNQPEATIPVAGLIRNVNRQLNQDGIVGIKTGNTEGAGGCYLVASKRVVSGHQITTIGAVMGAPNLTTAMVDSRALLRASDTGFEEVVVVQKGQSLGEYTVAWGGKVTAHAKENISVFRWKGSKTKFTTSLNPQETPIKKGSQVGTVEVSSGNQKQQVAAVLAQDINAPALRWRIFR
ncbi:D-alanyl-D-alanine carboxypeptidase [Candidatus Saccharibacteria bacterium]|nr:D-alanyl-D-alanine carboxypeptidase [Candidatus Saccharibacteria bacterium]